MADILIRGMDKPGGCDDCDFCKIQDINFDLLYYCSRTERFIDEEEACNIPSDCPIHELPEHGDLIDRDKLLEEDIDLFIEYDDFEDESGCSTDVIRNAPVIVPSNKEDAE